MKPPVYSTEIFGNNEDHPFDGSYSAYIKKSLGDVEVRYIEGAEDYMIHAEFRHSGDTKLTLESPTGEKTVYDLHVERDTYSYEKVTP